MSFLYFLAAHRSPGLTNFAEVGRYLGENLILILILCEMYWCRNKKTAIVISYVYGFSGMLCQDLKILLRIPRPWVLNPDFQPLGTAMTTATGYSFPSVHTQTAVSIYGTMAGLSAHRTEKILFSLLFLIVAFSRMYAGVHTPYDVCAALLIALLILWLFLRYGQPLLESGREQKLMIFGLCASLASMLLVVILLQIGFNPPELSQDTAKMAGAATGLFLGRWLERRYVNFTTECSKGQKSFRLILGLIAAVGFEVGLKPILSPLGSFGAFLRYCIVLLFIIAIWPALFSRFEKKKTV